MVHESAVANQPENIILGRGPARLNTLLNFTVGDLAVVLTDTETCLTF